MVADQMNVIRHLIRLSRALLILTNGGAWVARGDESGALTPSAINLEQHSYVGSSRALPAQIGTLTLFVGATGDTVREIAMDRQVENGITDGDLTTMAGHLFEGYTIRRIEYQGGQHSIAWMLRSDGVLLGLTYVPEENSYGWHRHDTDGGTIEDICVVPEADGDVLYLVVLREIDGSPVRYLEKLERRPILFTDALLITDAFFVDCGLTYDGVSTTTIDGLEHLEGETVYALADGLVQGPFTVTAGEIELDTAAEVVHVGLRITAELETLDLDVQGSGVRDHLKKVQSLGVLVHASCGGFYAGQTAATLLQHKRPVWQSATGIRSGYEEVNLKASFTEHGRTLIRHLEPTPLTVLGLIPRVEVGG
jgi:hypothetical protein